ncbi:hypothetical protein SAMN04515674_101589 [Pseudarcicella hirudinis]|uniref:Uncharacterized protein n=1 Tax=Pseudarcicella hirudinis TaxID=1079859 RepID=A0A1I5N4F5_9BACT|nr:hypothetical protein SAMN04515674_101589 [Pseudarcicella hirudinis]
MCPISLCGYNVVIHSQNFYVPYIPMWLQCGYLVRLHLCALYSYVVAMFRSIHKTSMCPMFLCGCNVLLSYKTSMCPIFLCGCNVSIWLQPRIAFYRILFTFVIPQVWFLVVLFCYEKRLPISMNSLFCYILSYRISSAFQKLQLPALQQSCQH